MGSVKIFQTSDVLHSFVHQDLIVVPWVYIVCMQTHDPCSHILDAVLFLLYKECKPCWFVQLNESAGPLKSKLINQQNGKLETMYFLERNVRISLLTRNVKHLFHAQWKFSLKDNEVEVSGGGLDGIYSTLQFSLSLGRYWPPSRLGAHDWPAQISHGGTLVFDIHSERSF